MNFSISNVCWTEVNGQRKKKIYSRTYIQLEENHADYIPIFETNVYVPCARATEWINLWPRRFRWNFNFGAPASNRAPFEHRTHTHTYEMETNANLSVHQFWASLLSALHKWINAVNSPAPVDHQIKLIHILIIYIVGFSIYAKAGMRCLHGNRVLTMAKVRCSLSQSLSLSLFLPE